MECPICGNKQGFAFGICVRCNYNQISNQFRQVLVDVDLLEEFLPPHIFYKVLEEHETRYTKWSKE